VPREEPRKYGQFHVTALYHNERIKALDTTKIISRETLCYSSEPRIFLPPPEPGAREVEIKILERLRGREAVDI
jgi:hypothetical protein